MEKLGEKIVIGLVGEKGSGKETFTDILQAVLPNRPISRLRFSGILADTLHIWDAPVTRENLQDLAIKMREFLGENALSHAMHTRVLSQSSEIVVIDGIRWQSDYDLLRQFPRNLLIYITADIKLRFERTKARKEKAGEEETTFEKFLKEEQKENELLIGRIGKEADYTIINNGSLDEFRDRVIKIANNIFAPV